MTDTEILDRVAGRVILLDQDGRVLLFEAFDPAAPETPWWNTPGGGVDTGETPQEAAARELFEETGLVATPAELGPQIFQDYEEFTFDGVIFHQHNHFFLFRTSTTEISIAGFEESEQRSHLGLHWWSIEELEQTDVEFYPEELPDLLKGLHSCDH